MFLGLLIKISCEFMGNPKYASILTYQVSKIVKEYQTIAPFLIHNFKWPNLGEFERKSPLSYIGKAGMVDIN